MAQGLDLEKARQIRERYKAGGISQTALATEYGTTQPMISLVVRGLMFKEPSSEVSVVEPVPPPAQTQELHLVALQPGQLAACQQQLIAWADSKCRTEQQGVEDLAENLSAAIAAGFRTTVIERHLRLAERRVIFFEKIGEALKAGYYIVPNMPMDVFAIRAKGNAPSKRTSWQYEKDSWGQHDSLRPIEPPKLLPVGEGEYKNPKLAERYRTFPYEDKGKQMIQYLTESNGYLEEIDFPFALARPEVLTATHQAMLLNIFDEIGVMPGRQERRSDPMVIGRLRNPNRPNDRDRDVSFLIAWFLDTDRIR
jgi:hypothetical protein